MKYLLLFFLISTTAFTQNYHYAVDEAKEAATPDTTAPTSPINLVVNNITKTTATLNWTASTDDVGVVIYRIYNNNILLSSTEGPETFYTLTNLTSATDYNITVRALDAASNESSNSNSQTFATSALNLSENQLEEIAYFSAYLLPLSQKSQLQSALDTYGAVRLEKGDYSGVANITMTSNQSLYGHPEFTKVPPLIIASGSTNIHVESITVYANQPITFQAGSPITNSEFKHISGTTLKTIGGSLEDNLFININAQIDFDCSAGGYLKNNRVYRHMVHTISPQLVLKGNNTTPSNGNLFVWTNYLTPNGDAVIMDNVGDITFIGLDSEGWNLRDQETVNAMFYARNMGNVKITDFGGGNGYCNGCETRPWDIEADNLLFFNKVIGNNTAREGITPVANASIARTDTNVFTIKNALLKEIYEIESGSKGIHLQGHFYGNSDVTGYPNFSIGFNGAIQRSTFTNPSVIETLTNQILSPKRTPYPRAVFETLPNPTGEQWETERIGKPDSRDYIQGLIDTNRIAELPEGIYYIGSTLYLNGNVGTQQGIIGAGTGKTAIVGLTDDFPLITLTTNSDQSLRYHLANLTLQGGSTGVYFTTDIRLAATNTWKYVVFRNQNYGIHLKEIFGFDNNFLDNLSFVNCNIGVFNDPKNKNLANFDMMQDAGYIDKTVYYRNQFINCGTALQVQSFRGSNLNTWIDCKFDGNGLIADLGGNNMPSFVNCDFTNNRGGSSTNSLMRGDVPSLYSCKFSGNTSRYIFDTVGLIAEGCDFLDNNQLMSSITHADQSQYIMNSTINGALGGGWRNNNGIYINSKLNQNTGLSKLFVNMNGGVISVTGDNTTTTMIDIPADPYPQLFVKH